MVKLVEMAKLSKSILHVIKTNPDVVSKVYSENESFINCLEQLRIGNLSKTCLNTLLENLDKHDYTKTENCRKLKDLLTALTVKPVSGGRRLKRKTRGRVGGKRRQTRRRS